MWGAGAPSPLPEGSGEGALRPPQKKLILDLKMYTYSAFWVLFSPAVVPVVHAKTLLLGFKNLLLHANRQQRR